MVQNERTNNNNNIYGSNRCHFQKDTRSIESNRSVERRCWCYYVYAYPVRIQTKTYSPKSFQKCAIHIRLYTYSFCNC